MNLHEHLQEAAARVLADGPVPVLKLAKLVPADQGDRGHASAEALVRWITKGRGGVRLDGARLAGKGWCSSVAALARFSAALAAKELGAVVEVSAPCERERRAAAACAELDRLRAQGRKRK